MYSHKAFLTDGADWGAAHTKKNGYTLMELIIAVTIFTTFLSIATGSYMTLTKANRQASQTAAVGREVAHVMDTIAEEARGGEPDFSCRETEAAGTECFGAVRRNGVERTQYKFDRSAKKILVMRQERPNMLSPWSAGSWTPFTTNSLAVDRLEFSEIEGAVTFELETAGRVFKNTIASRKYEK